MEFEFGENRITLGCVILYFSCCLASSGGLGGGGLNVSIFLVIMGFDYENAIILSLCTVLGNYLTQSSLNLMKTHPHLSSRPLIDFNSVLVFVPAQLGGNTIGVVIAAIVPATPLLAASLVIIAFAFVSTCSTALLLWEEETHAINSSDNTAAIRASSKYGNYTDASPEELTSLCNPSPIVDGNNQAMDIAVVDRSHHPFEPTIAPVIDFKIFRVLVFVWLLLSGLQSQTVSSMTKSSSIFQKLYQVEETNKSRIHTDDNQSIEVTQSPNGGPREVELFSNECADHLQASTEVINVNQKDNLTFDFRILRVLLLLWLVFAGLHVSMETATSKCTPLYFSLLSMSFIPLAVTIVWGVRYITKHQQRDSTVILDGDIDFSKLAYYPAVLAFFIGIMCSLLGIGGGELMGPLFLSLGLLPQVTAATTSFMSMMSSSSNILHYAIMGEIDYRWGLLTFAIGTAGGLTGRLGVLYLVHKYKRASLTAFALALVLLVSIALVFYDLLSEEMSFEFGSFCA